MRPLELEAFNNIPPIKPARFVTGKTKEREIIEDEFNPVMKVS